MPPCATWKDTPLVRPGQGVDAVALADVQQGNEVDFAAEEVVVRGAGEAMIMTITRP
jgi:hypothetical protein